MATFSISATARKAQATGTGGAGPFSFSFQVNAQSELAVYVDTTLKTLTTHYTVSLNADGTGSISFTSGNEPTTSQTITILGNAPLSRTSVYTSGGNITATALETDFDTNVMVQQQQQEILDRAMVGPVDDPSSADMTLPGKEARKGRVLGFNATSGDPEAGPEIADVSTLASITADIATLADIEDGTDATDAIQTVAGISSDVTTVSGISGNVTTVAGISSDVTTVAADGTDIGTVAGISSDVSTVAGISSNVTTTAGISANITTVAGISSNVTTVAGNNANVTTVAGVSSDVTTVAGISSDVTTAATNVTDITNFADVYIGAATTDPTVRTDGSALQAGDLYFNTVSAELRAYSGSTWVAGTASTLTAQNFSGDNSTTAFTLAATPASENNTQVYVDGVYQQKNTYSVSGTTLTFSEAPPTGTNNIEVMLISTVAVGTTDASLVTFTNSNTGGVQQNLDDKLEQEMVSLLDFGADATGASDSATAIQAAFDSGAKKVYMPAGTYRSDSALTIPKNVSLVGDGMEATKLDFTNRTGGGTDLSTTGSSLTSLGVPSANITKNDTTITMTSTPSVVKGDVIILYNDTDGSWSGFRTYYRAGEMAQVASVSGNTITILGTFADTYTAADIEVFKVTNGTTATFRDFTVLGHEDTPSSSFGFTINRGIDCRIENVRVTGSSYAGMSIDQCFNTEIIGCRCEENATNDHGTDYGLSIGNSTWVRVIGGYFNASRHAIAIGGAGEDGDAPCRYISHIGVHASTQGTVFALDCHGNSEHISYEGCHVDGGLTISGDHTRVVNCSIFGLNNPTNIYYSEIKGGNHMVANNQFHADNFTSSRGCFIDIGGNSSAISSDTQDGGIISITGNTMIYNGTGEVEAGIYIRNHGYTGDKIDVNLTNNIMRYTQISTRIPLRAISHALHLRSNSGSGGFGHVTVIGNDFDGGIEFDNDTGSNTGHVLSANVTGNKVQWGTRLQVTGSAGNVQIKNNMASNMSSYLGLAGFGDGVTAQISGNTLHNCNWAGTSSSTTRTSLRVWTGGTDSNVMVQNNFITFDAKVVRVNSSSGFTNGETITGGTSGATATVVSTPISIWIAVGDTISGTFQAGETVTGGTSGTTATVDTTPTSSVRTYSQSYNSLANLWRDNNIDAAGTGSYSNNVTSDTTTI